MKKPYVMLAVSGILLLVVLLRIPNLFEPSWFVDDALYLTVGNALRHGAVLYKDIVDNKPPVIYIFGLLPNLFSLSLANMAISVLSVWMFWNLCTYLMGLPAAFAATLFFGVLTSVPTFKGNLFNAELLFDAFEIVGTWLLVSLIFPRRKGSGGRILAAGLFASGVLYGLAILSKAPAVFSVAAVLIAVLFPYRVKTGDSHISRELRMSVVKYLIPGTLVPIAVSLIVFALRGAAADYVYWTAIYTVHYSVNQFMHVRFASPTTAWIFSLPVKSVLVLLLILAIGFSRLKFPIRLALLWFGLSLYGSLLSLRPYPSYFLQMMPPLALLFGPAVGSPRKLLYKTEVIAAAIAFIVFYEVIRVMDIRLYPTVRYYKNFYLYATQQESYTTYISWFNPQVDESMDPTHNRMFLESNEKAKALLAPLHPTSMFIWGTNPMLWADTGILAAQKYPLTFYVEDLQNYSEVFTGIERWKPDIIVRMKFRPYKFSELYDYIDAHYKLLEDYPTMTVYRRLTV